MGVLCVYTGRPFNEGGPMETETVEKEDISYSAMRHAQLNRDFEEDMSFAKNILDDTDHLRKHIDRLTRYIDDVRRGSN